MNQKPSPVNQVINENLTFYLSICSGLFLFLLFFQPFPEDSFDSNNRLIFDLGTGAIVFFFLASIKISYLWYEQRAGSNADEQLIPVLLSNFAFLSLSSAALIFYLHFVGTVVITFFVVFKVGLIGLVLLIIVNLYDKITRIKHQNEMLVLEKKILQKQVEKYEEDILNKTIQFSSDNNSESLNLKIAEIALVKSSDNYVEIVFKEEDVFKKKVIRNTLKNIELQIKPYSNFIRSHRTSIVNIHYIDKLSRNFNQHWISIKGYQETVPVSRQYLLKLKETL